MREAYYSLGDEDIAHIRQILENIKATWKQHIFFHADDREFHMSLFSRLNNQTLLSLMDAIWSVTKTSTLKKNSSTSTTQSSATRTSSTRWKRATKRPSRPRC